MYKLKVNNSGIIWYLDGKIIRDNDPPAVEVINLGFTSTGGTGLLAQLVYGQTVAWNTGSIVKNRLMNNGNNVHTTISAK